MGRWYCLEIRNWRSKISTKIKQLIRETRMATLLIKCPTSGKSVPTGFGMDPVSFAEPTNQLFGNSFRCPACGKIHTWDKKDAFLEEEPKV
jgi:transposase-like protein